MGGIHKDKSNWAIGGGLLTGLGAGLCFLEMSALVFVGSIIAGLGVGLVIAAVISSRNSPPGT